MQFGDGDVSLGLRKFIEVREGLRKYLILFFNVMKEGEDAFGYFGELRRVLLAAPVQKAPYYFDVHVYEDHRGKRRETSGRSVGRGGDAT